MEVIAKVFPSELPTPPSEVVASVFQEEPLFEVEESPPRTKGDIIGFIYGEDDEHSDTDESIDITDRKCEISSCYLLMDWQTNLTNCSKNSHSRENMNIETNGYAQLNNMLAESLDDGEEEIE